MKESQPSGDAHGDELYEAFQKLFAKVDQTRYKFSPQENQWLRNCKKEVVDAAWRGSVLGAAVAWVLTRRSKVSKSQSAGLGSWITRVLFCAGFGCTGAAINASPVLGRCKERLVFLEGSPLQVELLAILQKDYPNAPVLKKYLEYQSANELAHASTVYDEYGDVFMRRLPANQNSEPHEVLGGQEEQAWSKSPPEKKAATLPTLSRRLPSPTGRRGQVKQVREDSDSPLINFFEFSPWNNDEESNSSEASRLKDTAKERRRSRMTPEERRTYNRQQYLERQQKPVQEREAAL